MIPKLISYNDLAERLGVSKMTIRRWIKAGHIPAPLRFGVGRVMWVESEIEDWLEAKRVQNPQ